MANTYPALRALAKIAEARQRVTVCTGPCMYPQHHSGDESGMEFAYRLRDIARAALAAEAAPLASAFKATSEDIAAAREMGYQEGLAAAEALRDVATALREVLLPAAWQAHSSGGIITVLSPQHYDNLTATLARYDAALAATSREDSDD